MKNLLLKPFEMVGDISRKVHASLVIQQMEYMKCPRSRKLYTASAALTFSTLCLASTAHAGDGIAGMVNSAATQGDAIKASLGKLFSAGGFGLAGYGGYNWWRKGKEGENSQVKAGQIFTPILGGAVLGATGYVLVKAGETVGIQGSSQGQLPN